MGTIRLIAKIAAWAAVVVGLVASGKLAFGDEASAAPALREVLPYELWDRETLTITPAVTSDVPIRIGLRLGADATDVLRMEQWVKSHGVEVRIAVSGGGAPESWTVDESSKAEWNMPESALFLGRRDVSLTKGKSVEIRATAAGADTVFEDHSPFLIAGAIVEPPRPEPEEARWPGLTLIIGSAGAFMHLFFVLARLLVPFRDVGDEILGDGEAP